MSRQYPDHCMLDIETLGIRPGSVILSIGAVKFDLYSDTPVPMPGDPATLHMTFTAHVSVTDSVRHGLTIDPSTVLWWLAQSEVARQDVVQGQRAAMPLQQALIAFSCWLSNSPPAKYVWAHGATFDPVLLAAAYIAADVDNPMNFRNVRDTRTLYAMAKDLIPNPPAWPEPPLQHAAIWDAWTQAEYARRCALALATAAAEATAAALAASAALAALATASPYNNTIFAPSPAQH